MEVLFIDAAQQFLRLFQDVAVMTLVGRIQQLLLFIQHGAFDGRAAYIKTNSQVLILLLGNAMMGRPPHPLLDSEQGVPSADIINYIVFFYKTQSVHFILHEISTFSVTKKQTFCECRPFVTLFRQKRLAERGVSRYPYKNSFLPAALATPADAF